MQFLKRTFTDAIERDEFQLVYQPQTDSRDSQVVGVEALLRWHSPEYGDISPVEFIPIIEQLDLISEVGDIVIHKSCEQLAYWKAKHDTDLRMAINVSYMQVHSRKIIQTFEDCMTKYGIQSRELEIELTESSLIRDKSIVINILKSIKDMGIRTAIDDFGTGYSSLNHLASMPFDLLKIDRSFIARVGKDKACTTITESIISMAKNLEMDVLAEGVETEQQLGFLTRNGCDLLQGNYISRPVDASEIPDFVIQKELKILPKKYVS